jgi:Xaa-Pro aminopeptidase
MNLDTDIRDRLSRVQRRLTERGLAGLVVHFNGQHYMLRFNPMLYFSGLKALGPAFMFIPAEGKPSLLVSPDWDDARARAVARWADVESIAEEGLAAEATQRARRYKGPIGFAGRRYLTQDMAHALPWAFDPAVVDADELVAGLATTRSEYEQACIERAAAVADEGFRALYETVHIGMRECELAAEIEYAMQAAGSEDNYGLISTGPHNRSVRAPIDRRLEAGDLVIGEITPCIDGCFAQLCRTLVLGKPSELLREKYELLLRAQEAELAAALPGRSSTEMAAAANAVLTAAGYGDYCRPPYMRARGHGMGFGGVVPLEISANEDVTLAPGMSMVVHPNQYIPETGYLMLGDTIVIADDAPRVLTKTPRHLFSKEL